MERQLMVSGPINRTDIFKYRMFAVFHPNICSAETKCIGQKRGEDLFFFVVAKNLDNQ